MATTINLKKTLTRPFWEQCNPSPAVSGAAAFMRGWGEAAYIPNIGYFCVNTTSSVWEYNPSNDTEINLPASGIAGTFGAGSCGRILPMGPSGTASAGSTTTLTTALTIPRDLRGYKLRITGGPGAGDERIIASNTLGASAVITVTSAFSATITASSTYQLITPRLCIFNPAATPGLGFWDWALSTWTAGRSVAGVTFAGTDGVLVSTAGIIGNRLDSSDSRGGAALTTSTTTVLTLAAASIPNSGRTWIVNEWAGAVIQILAGTAAGQTRIVTSNTAGTITVGTAFGVAPDATSVWLLTKAPASSGSNSAAFSAGTTALLTLTGVNWTVNQWANSQVRAIAGTGAGQVRSIASNTATTLTPSAVWGTAFDSTTIWVIEGNDDFIYLAGNGAVAMFRYSISGNAWTTAAATAARAGGPGAGMSLTWINGVTDSAWTNENAIRNGRFLYSFRAGGGNLLDIYDLALTTWESNRIYANQFEVFTTGVSWEHLGGGQIACAQAVTGRFYVFDVRLNALIQLTEHAISQGAAVVGDKLIAFNYEDGSTRVPILYHWCNTSTYVMRCMLWFAQ